MDHTVTQLLRRWQDGDSQALDLIIPQTMPELHRLARSALNRNAGGDDLQPTELINEAYLKLVDLKEMNWESRVQFFGLAAKVMRNILVDQARMMAAKKRSSDNADDPYFFEIYGAGKLTAEELTELNEALEALAEMDKRKAAVVEMRFFAGMSYKEIAAFFNVAEKTAKRDWQFAKVWIYQKWKNG